MALKAVPTPLAAEAGILAAMTIKIKTRARSVRPVHKVPQVHKVLSVRKALRGRLALEACKALQGCVDLRVHKDP